MGKAEAIPLSDSSMEVITAAGSLNYVDLDLFFPEAVRVLAAQALLVVYDFLAGKGFRSATVGITMSPGFYLDYMMTESNAAAAIRGGTPRHNKGCALEFLGKGFGSPEARI